MQTSKQGFNFVLNRLTGEPVLSAMTQS